MRKEKKGEMINKNLEDEDLSKFIVLLGKKLLIYINLF